MREERSHPFAGDDVADGIIVHAIANDHRDAAVECPGGGGHLALHAAQADARFLPKSDRLVALWVVGVQQLGAILSGRLRVDAVHVGHEEERIGAHLHGQLSRQ